VDEAIESGSLKKKEALEDVEDAESKVTAEAAEKA
jgi:hypothetical protein